MKKKERQGDGNRFYLGLLLADLLLKSLCLNFGRVVFNSGVGLGIGDGVYLQIFGVRVLAFGAILVLWWWWRTKMIGVGERLVIIGGISNLIDRVLYGKVVDYLHFSQLNLWLNLGDIYITLGAVLIIGQALNVKIKGWK